ncbi:hypothetical protein ASE37_11390 [Rhizobium sp. Root268]|nr:hypothetical protein ASC86_11395 [Rhizobium sp. Root1212]KRD25897.1 hypothetical protein ASE37_11390 [Rhizobium sp. Root268]
MGNAGERPFVFPWEQAKKREISSAMQHGIADWHQEMRRLTGFVRRTAGMEKPAQQMPDGLGRRL